MIDGYRLFARKVLRSRVFPWSIPSEPQGAQADVFRVLKGLKARTVALRPSLSRGC